jgi:PAS domain S-box-containing protein
LGAKSDKELIGKPIAEFIHPDFRRRSLKLLSYMRKKGVTLPPREVKFVRLDGRDFDVEVAATALMYKDKSAAQIVFRDISAARR